MGLIEDLASDIVNDVGDSHAIIAGRRCGKSSMLVALKHQLGQPAVMESGDWRALPLLFDFKSGAFDSAGAILAHLLQEVCRRVGASVRRRPPDAWPDPIELEEGWLRDMTTKSTLTLRDFEDAVGHILDRLGTPLEPVLLVLLLDEMDETLGNTWTADLFNQLRALIYSGDLKEEVRLVLTGSRRFLDEMSDRGSPLWNILKLHYLSAFNKADAEKLIQRADGLPREAALAVWRHGGGHPFLTQYLLHHLWESGPACADAAAVERLSTRFRIERAPDLEGWTRAVETVGLRMYGILAQFPGWAGESDIHRIIDFPMVDAKRGLVALCYHGLAEHDGSWERYRRTGDLFKAWFDELGPVAEGAGKIKEEEPSKKTPIVFISYSHKDEKEKEKLVSHLKVMEKTGALELWYDDLIRGGADWEKEIEEKMSRADVAILLISANFLSSDFILGREAPGLLERREKEGMTVFPVIARPCAWREVDWLSKMNVRPKNGKPIWDGDGGHEDGKLAEIAGEIADIVKRM